MPRFGALGKFFGNTVSTGAGYAAGVATGPALSPAVEEIRQEAWALHPDRLPDVGTLANGVAQGQVPRAQATAWARRHGFDKDKFDALVDVANTGPGVPVAFDLWRRDIIKEAGFRRAAKRQGLEEEWIDDLVKLKTDVLDPGQLAAAIHRGLIPDPGLLQGDQPGPDRKVPAYPVYQIDALDEAAASGYDKKRLGVLVGLQGLPMGVIQAAQALFRKIITHDDYLAAFAQSNSRNEWAAAVLEFARQIPTARDFFENALRGYHELPWALEQAKRHGMSEEDALIIYQNQGRPMTVKLITQALARGGKFMPEEGEQKDPYQASIIEGNLKPAYYDLAKALRYNYPSPFALRSLIATGAISVADGEQVLLYQGWEPTFAAKVAQAWATTKTSASKEATATDLLALYSSGHRTLTSTLRALENLGYPTEEAQTKVDVIDARRVVSEETRVITALHKLYIDGALSETEARTAMTDLGVAEWARDQIIRVWNVQKATA